MSHPSFAFLCQNAFYGSFIKGIHEINPKDSGDIPPGTQTAGEYRNTLWVIPCTPGIMLCMCASLRSDFSLIAPRNITSAPGVEKCPTASPLNITTEHPAHRLQRCVPACCRSQHSKGKKKTARKITPANFVFFVIFLKWVRLCSSPSACRVSLLRSTGQRDTLSPWWTTAASVCPCLAFLHPLFGHSNSALDKSGSFSLAQKRSGATLVPLFPSRCRFFVCQNGKS